VKKGLLVIIPAYNEEHVIASTIAGVLQATANKSQVLVIDDGSTDRTSNIARQAGAKVLRHPINRGLGGALGTGLFWAKVHDFNWVITFDKADVVIGTRTKIGWKDIPIDRKLIIMLSNFFTWWIFGIMTSDSTSGLRSFNRRAIELIRIRTDQMEVSNEFFSEVKRHRLRLSEVPIKVIYTDYSRSKGQNSSLFRFKSWLHCSYCLPFPEFGYEPRKDQLAGECFYFGP
jgi:glycosyltransferase involved in cell wall biosynthesis